MLEFIKRTARLLLPPIFIGIGRGVRETRAQNEAQNTFEGIYCNFSEITDITNYNSEASLKEIYDQTVDQLKEYESGYALPSSHDRSQITNLLPLLMASMHIDGKMSLLDYGGGAGRTFIDCLKSVDATNLHYYVYDLPETIRLGRELFSDLASEKHNIEFIDDLSVIDRIDIVYLGSVLQYLPDYKTVLLSVIHKQPKYFLITDNFMGKHPTFATVQVNMPGRRMAYWIFQMEEIVLLFRNNGYELVYKSMNYQPFHHFNNFPEEYRVKDSCNLLFHGL